MASLPFIFLIFLCFLNSTFSQNQLKYQASILVSVKDSLDSHNPFLDSWNLSNYTNLCSWAGVKCDEIKNRYSVLFLDISNLNISGPLSPSITKLETLKSLNISNNQFNGSLSFDFTSMKELEVFDAYDNSFSGSLPLGFTKIPNLKHLNLGGNYFSGEIPAVYGNSFPQLNYLSLAGNDLRGFIPHELGNLTNLTYLYLGYFNQFEGGVPSEFGILSNLVHLDLSNCGLKGEIPQEIGNLKNLDTLFLQRNELSGSIPSQFGNLTSLKSLDLSINELTGEIPVEFSSLKELTLLSLFINNFHGNIPRSIAELPKLERLLLWRNNFTGSIPSKLGSTGSLIELDLSTNKLTGTIPESLCSGRKLKVLILLNNFLFGSLPEDLGKCESLSRVRIGQNYLSGKIPNGLLYMPELSFLELQNNYLTGKILQEKRKVRSKLDQLNLSNNRLFGSIPSSVENFPGLKILILSGNKFTGNIPPELGRLKNILKVDLSRNNFSGEIPNEVGNCLSLTYIDFSQNELNGPIPIQISQIHVLNYLNVSYNHLNDSLPKEIGSIKSLTSADFSYNNLTGSIPESGQYLFFNATSFVGNADLCGFYFTPCATSSSASPLNLIKGTNPKVPSKYKLIFAIGLLLCSLVFVFLAILKTRKFNGKSNVWKLTAFQKLGFGSDDVVECLKDNNIIGKGGAGTVYSGTMPNGEKVAIKKLFGGKSGGFATSSHDNGLSAEIQTLGKIRHRYIVRLLAFCSNKDTNLLVYEYMPNGSLGEVLHGKNGGCLVWETRLKIAIEAAKGLCYLHHDCSPLILHRDVKSNNILLSSDYEAHVADFGLAKFLHDTGTSECMSAIAGSYGYIAPEYAYTLKVDEKSDVYSFGVVLLELVTGRKPVGDFGEEGLDIVQWVKIQTNWIKEKAAKVVDERLKNVPINEAMQVFFVAMLCVQEHSVERPSMREVVQMLGQAKQQQPNGFHMQ